MNFAIPCLLNLMLMLKRWCPNQGLGPACLCGPRNAANLHQCPLVLGFSTGEAVEYRRCRRSNHNPQRRNHSPHNSPRMSSLGRRSCSVCRPPKLLSPTTWYSPFVLQVHLPPKNHPLVLCRCYNTELLALCPLWTKLEIPLDDSTHSRLGHRFAGSPLLHLRLVRFPHRPFQAHKIPFLDITSLCDRSRRTKVVPNALGNLSRWTVPPMGKLGSIISSSGSLLVAVARSSRCTARSRLRHDSSPDHDPLPHNLHPHRCPSPRLHIHHPRSLNITR